jgi:hypothetical protein
VAASDILEPQGQDLMLLVLYLFQVGGCNI